MKKAIIFYLGFMVTVLTTVAQTAPAPIIEWQKCYGGAGNEGTTTDFHQTKDGGWIIATESDSNSGDVSGNHGYNDYWVVKLNSMGMMEWEKSYGGSQNEEISSIQQTTDGGYFVTGTTDSHDGDVTGYHGGYPLPDIWVVKIDSIGNIQWERCLGGSEADDDGGTIQTADGGFIIAGSTDSRNGDVVGHHNLGGLYLDGDAWLVKLDNKGNIQWQKCYGGSGDDGFSYIKKTMDGGYIFAGGTDSEDGDLLNDITYGGNDIWVVKTDSMGNIAWQKKYGGSQIEWPGYIIETLERGYIFIGITFSNDGEVSGNHGMMDSWVVKLDSIGNIEWQKCYGGSQTDAFNLIQELSDGYFISGVSLSVDGDLSQIYKNGHTWVLKIDKTGNIAWQQCYGGISGYGNAIQIIDGSYMMMGYAGDSKDVDSSCNHGLEDVWIVKLSKESIPIKAIWTNQQLNIYPNPAHGTVGVETQNIEQIRIMDVEGRIYINQHINNDSIGQYTYFNIQYMARGIYIIQAVMNDGSIKAGKLIVE